MAETRKKKAPQEPKARAAKGAEKGEKAAKGAAPSAPARPPAGPHARLRFHRVAPRKVRLVADHVRGMKVGDALAMLRYTPQAAAKHLAMALRSADRELSGRRGEVQRVEKDW